MIRAEPSEHLEKLESGRKMLIATFERLYNGPADAYSYL